MKFSFQDIDKIITIVNNHINQVNIVFTNNKNKIYEFTCSLNHSESIQKIKDVCNNLVIPYQDKYLELLNEFLTALVALKQTYNDEVDYIDWDEEKLSTAHNDVELVKTHIQSIDDELNYCPHKGGFYLDMEAKTNNLKNDLCSLQRKIEKISNDLENFCNSNFFEYLKQEFENLTYQNLEYAKNHNNADLINEIENTNTIINKYYIDIPKMHDFDDYSSYLEAVLVYALANGKAKLTFNSENQVAITFNEHFKFSRYGEPLEEQLQIIGVKHNGEWKYLPIFTTLKDGSRFITIPNSMLIKDGDQAKFKPFNNVEDFFSLYFSGKWEEGDIISSISSRELDLLLNKKENEMVKKFVKNSLNEDLVTQFFIIYLKADMVLNNIDPNLKDVNQHSIECMGAPINFLMIEHVVHASGSIRSIASIAGKVGRSVHSKMDYDKSNDVNYDMTYDQAMKDTDIESSFYKNQNGTVKLHPSIEKYYCDILNRNLEKK